VAFEEVAGAGDYHKLNWYVFLELRNEFPKLLDISKLVVFAVDQQ
jgi:hypothetical protein